MNPHPEAWLDPATALVIGTALTLLWDRIRRYQDKRGE